MLVLLKNFVLFYFIINIIITFVALKYDSPKNAIENYGYWVLTKAILRLLFGGLIFAILQIIDDF